MSLVLDGSTQYAYHADSPLTAYTISIAAWFKTDDYTTSWQAICGLYDYSSTSYWNVLALNIDASNGTLHAESRGGQEYKAASSSLVEDAAWHHGVGIFSASNARAVWLDGSEDTNAQETGESVANLDRIGIGRNEDSSPGQYFDGKLGEIAIYNDALTSGEISSLAGGAAPSAVNAGNLVAYWPLYDDENDDKGSYHLTLGGSPSFDTEDHPIEIAAPPSENIVPHLMHRAFMTRN